MDNYNNEVGRHWMSPVSPMTLWQTHVSCYFRGAIQRSKLGHRTSHYLRRNEPGHNRDIIHGLVQLYSVVTKTIASSCVRWGTNISHRSNPHGILSSISFLTGNEMDNPLFWGVLVRTETNGRTQNLIPSRNENKLEYLTEVWWFKDFYVIHSIQNVIHIIQNVIHIIQNVIHTQNVIHIQNVTHIIQFVIHIIQNAIHILQNVIHIIQNVIHIIQNHLAHACSKSNNYKHPT